ncbi:hypothetical protein Lal_00043272 [Lupinus albus]|nr:hypothetical protein Lal_00043272 [Lupinus albus]
MAPATTTCSSPTANVSREYDFAVLAYSCDQIRSILQAHDQRHYFDPSPPPPIPKKTQHQPHPHPLPMSLVNSTSPFFHTPLTESVALHKILRMTNSTISILLLRIPKILFLNSEEATTLATSSPTSNVFRESDLAIHAKSYKDIYNIIQAPLHDQLHNFDPNQESDHENDSSHHRQVLAQVLQPDHQSIREALQSHVPHITLTRLLTNYFDHNESSCDLYLLFYTSVRRNRYIHSTLYDFISILPDDSASLSKHHSDRAYDIFIEFDQHENPFFFPHAPHNFANICRNFSDRLKAIVDNSPLHQSLCKCLIVTVVGALVSTVLVTTNAVAGCVAVAAAPFCSNRCIPHPKKLERKKLVRLKQLNAAAKGTCAVNGLDTIGSLVDRLQNTVESDKDLVRIALKRGPGRGNSYWKCSSIFARTSRVFNNSLRILRNI